MQRTSAMIAEGEEIMPENSQSILQEKNRLILLKWLPEQGEYQTQIAGFSLFRFDEGESCENCFYEPAVGVVVQGNKRSVVGSEEYFYHEYDSLLNSVDLPSQNYILDATLEKPFLGVSLKIDRHIIGQLLMEQPELAQGSVETARGLCVMRIEVDVLDAFLRLTELLRDRYRCWLR